MKFELKVNNRNVSDQDLLDDLKKVAEELGKTTITRDEYDEKGRFNSGTLRKRLGGWLEALELAGLPATRKYNIEIEDLFQNIEEVWLKLGRQPNSTEMIPPLSKYSVPTYSHRFGNWTKALEKFVEYINPEEIETENTILTKPEIASRHKTNRTINWRLRFLVMRKDNFKCAICGRSPATNPEIILHVDHILAWDKGGETVYENLQTLCSVCNIGKSNLDLKTTDENGSH
jgi:hypothetical protein